MGRKAVTYLLFYLAVLFTALLLVAALLSRRASFVEPCEGKFWVTMAMLMPVFLAANLALFVWWLVRRRWVVSLMPAAALVLNMGYIASMLQLPDYRGRNTEHDLRVATLNTNGFRRMGDTAVSAAAIARMADDEKIDVLCMQEFVETRAFPADSIGKLFAPRMPFFVREEGQAVVSRYPILRHDYVRFPQTNNDYMWADLLVGEDTVRLFSVHLQTSGITALRNRFRKDYNRDIPVDVMFGELDRNSRIRTGQVKHIRAVIDSTHYPVILAGDFNDMPSSYTYRRMKGDLTDGFRAVGNGYGGTFRYIGGLLRIDYIFYGDAFAGVRYYTPEADVSDHKAVVADLNRKR